MQSLKNSKPILVGSVAVAALIGGYQLYKNYQINQQKMIQEGLKAELDKQGKYLSQKNAQIRRSILNGNVEYKMGLCAPKGKKYAGFIEISFNIKSVDHLFLDFESQEGKIEELQVNGKSINSYLWNQYFIMIPKNELKEGANTVSILFVNDYVTDGEGFHTFTDTDSKQYVFTDFEPSYCRKWIPSIDQPDVKCNMTLSVIVPEDWKAISNEIKSQEVHDNLDRHFMEFCDNNLIRKIVHPKLQIKNLQDMRVWNFKKTPVMSTYLLHLSVGPFLEIKAKETYKQIPMSLYCRESLYEDLLKQQDRYFETTSKCMAFYEKFFHYEFPFSKYDHIFCPEFNSGAMENVGAITVNDLYIFKDDVKKSTRANIVSLVTHELCHMWFGDLVTMQWWNDLWLNESFADWLSFYSASHLDLSFDKFDFMAVFNDRKAWGYSTDMSNASHPIAGEVLDAQQARSIFDGITYSKGASVLKQLMFVMGEDNFSEALGKYFQKHQYQNTTLDDFFAAMALTFNVDKFKLEEWRKDWIERAGCNDLEPSFDRKNNKFIIKQGNVIDKFSKLRWHRINAAFFKQDGTHEVHKLWVENKETTEYTHLDFSQFNAVLLNWDDQAFCKVIIDQASFEFFSKNMTVIEGVMNQKIFIRALFEMIKDAKLTSKAFLNLLKQNSKFNLSEEILSSAFSYLLGSIHHYTPLKYQDQLYEDSFEMICEIIKNSESQLESDKDLRIMLASNLVHMAKVDKHIDLLVQKLNDQSKVLPSLQISYYSKWDIVEKVFRSDSMVEAGLHNEVLDSRLKEDKSDYGKRRVLTCEASLVQDSLEKSQLWSKFLNPEKDEPAHNVFAQMNGFNSRKIQDEFYHHKYFSDLKQVFDKHPITYSQSFLENLFPVSDNFEFILGNIDSLIIDLKKDELPILKKKLIEKKDYVKRRQAICEFYEKQEC